MHNFKFKPGDRVLWNTGAEKISEGTIRSAKTDLFNNKYIVVPSNAPKRELTLPEQYMVRGI